MCEPQASKAIIQITHHGRTGARVIPEAGSPSAEVEASIDSIERRRQTAQPTTTDELLGWRRDGQRG